MNTVTLQTGIWYNDHSIELTFPDSWEVETCWPDLPEPLTESEIRKRLGEPVGQSPLREIAKGAKRPVVVIDDLARPTPVCKIIDYVLEEFGAAGIKEEQITIVVATGTHGSQDEVGLANKIGRRAFTNCRIVVHNYKKNTRFIGKTSFGTPVHVNQEVLASDCLCGIGGIYPQHTTGFGGGSKLALGVLGRKSIVHLHFGNHGSVGGTYTIDNTFRRDLDEIARMIGFAFMMSLHVDARLNLVNLTCGDHFAYYSEAAAFSRKGYDAPLPVDGDVVIVNTYPSDVSYTFMRKGMKPLRCAPAHATKIAIGYNHEGVGEHGIFPQGGSSRVDNLRALRLRISTMGPRVIMAKILKRFTGSTESSVPVQPLDTQFELPDKIDNLLLYRPAGSAQPIPPIGGMQISDSWQDIVSKIKENHPDKDNLRVYIYPCASLQCLDHLQLKNNAMGTNEDISA